jgi:hypothetical protein
MVPGMSDRPDLSDAKQEAQSWLKSPVVAAAVLALAGALTGTLVTAINNQGQIDLERQKQDSSALLERQKYESSAILRVIENSQGDNVVLATNLLFLINAKLISDPEGIMRKHLNQQQKKLTALQGFKRA